MLSIIMCALLIPRGETWSEWQAIANNNWAKEYSYAPDVKFRARHNGESLFIQFDVQEQYTKAEVKEDNGEVWTDSCVEFFLAFDDSGYYNFEFTCIGKALLGFRKEKNNARHGDEKIMSMIKRKSSLGTECFAEKTGDNKWTLEVEIPVKTLFAHDVKSFNGLKATANFYKCGDNLSKPHFLSWNKIDMPTPNFHVPQFFGNVTFE